MGMYVRTIKRHNKDGSVVEYVQLAHNKRHPEKKYSQARVVYSLGRRDQLDVEAIKRLISSLSRFITPQDALDLQATDGESSRLRFVGSRPTGGALILNALWERVNIRQCLDKILKDRAFTGPMAKALFAMVANMALAPSSKTEVEQWAGNDVHPGYDEQIQVKDLYRSIDLLLEHQDTIQKEVFRSTANLLNMRGDLIFFDTTNTYLEIDATDGSELKDYAKSRHNRDNLTLVTIGLAVTREGIPLRCRVMPGNQNDAECVEQVQKDLNDWQFGRVVRAMDQGMTGEENKRILQRARGQYILGRKLSGTDADEEALNRGGRFRTINDDLQIKEVFVGKGTGRRRFIIAYNPQQAKHDQHTREKVLERINVELAAIDKLAGDKQLKAKSVLLAHGSMGPYIKEQKNGKLRINKARVKQFQKLDGKYMLRTNDASLSAEDVALGYKQLMEVEMAFRTLKSNLSLQTVYHTKDDRIRAHAMLCWLTLLLVRIAENETGLTWPCLRAEMERLHIGEFVNKTSRILQYTELTPNQRNILKKLKINPPPRFKKVDLTT